MLNSKRLYKVYYNNIQTLVTPSREKAHAEKARLKDAGVPWSTIRIVCANSITMKQLRLVGI